MLSFLEKEKIRNPNFAQTRADISKLIFSVSAMMARTSLIEITADEEKFEKLILYLRALRSEVLEGLRQ